MRDGHLQPSKLATVADVLRVVRDPNPVTDDYWWPIIKNLIPELKGPSAQRFLMWEVSYRNKLDSRTLALSRREVLRALAGY